MTGSEHEERIRSLIDRGEGTVVEYKSSLRWDYRESRVNRDLTKVAVKTIAAFMNSAGGTLLIGVGDDGVLLGLEPDLSSLSKKSLDGFELALRTALENHLGPEIDAAVHVDFVELDGVHVAVVACESHPSPVYYSQDGRRELWVRSGNSKKSLDPAAAVAYVQQHWPPNNTVTEERLRTVLQETLLPRATSTPLAPPDRVEQIPYWMNLSTRRVLDLFLSNLNRAHSWKRINIISPWISDIYGPNASINLDQMLRRFRDDDATVYVVTRPPEEKWHQEAIDRIAATQRANIALLPHLHVKLFTAQTAASSFAMLGSANFTTRSLTNREIGVLVSATGDGKALVRDLEYEAAEIYRDPNRKLMCKARL